MSEALQYKQREDEVYPKCWNGFKNILKTENVPFRLLDAGSKAGSDQSTAAGDSVTVTPRPFLPDSAEIKPVKSSVRTRSKRSLKLWTPYEAWTISATAQHPQVALVVFQILREKPVLLTKEH